MRSAATLRRSLLEPLPWRHSPPGPTPGWRTAPRAFLESASGSRPGPLREAAPHPQVAGFGLRPSRSPTTPPPPPLGVHTLQVAPFAGRPWLRCGRCAKASGKAPQWGDLAYSTCSPEGVGLPAPAPEWHRETHQLCGSGRGLATCRRCGLVTQLGRATQVSRRMCMPAASPLTAPPSPLTGASPSRHPRLAPRAPPSPAPHHPNVAQQPQAGSGP